MERTVPSATSEEIQLYRSTIYSLLRSNAEIKIRTLEEIHAGMNSLMHPGARSTTPDISAFIYSSLRLPDCMSEVRSVILGQNLNVFHRQGYGNVETWQPVSARARRRRCFFDGKDVMACYIASRSDIEDIIPSLTAYQMEWNKIHFLFQRWPRDIDLSHLETEPELRAMLSDILNIPPDDIDRLKAIWRDEFVAILKRIQQTERSIGVRLLSGSFSQYMRGTHEWFENIRNVCPDLPNRPVYFVSSNTHSLANLVTGFALQYEPELTQYVQQSGDIDLQNEWQTIQAGQARSRRENFLYYVMKKYQNTSAGRAALEEQYASEKAHGITRVVSEHTFDVEAQVFELNKIDPETLDPRLNNGDLAFLRESDALILNIDYPLGLAAYNILATIAIHIPEVRGIYSMGKSASLNAVRGDVIIPNVCQDEHSHNTYLFDNCFTVPDVAPYLVYGTVLDNQKAVCVLGTFLQNAKIMDIFYRENFGDLEMELGNFCSAVFESSRMQRYPIDEIVNLYKVPFDFGVLHYVSDTPMSKGKNLGAGTLSYYGMDSTYATTLAILRRILDQERKRANR